MSPLIYSVVFLILGIILIVLGLRGLIFQQPYIHAYRRMVWFIALAFSPSIINLCWSFWNLYQNSVERERAFEMSYLYIGLIALAIYFCSMVFYWRVMQGYLITGVTETSFRQALYAVLDELKIPFEERLSKLHLTDSKIDIHAVVSDWAGTAALRIKDRRHRETLDKIAEGLKKYFAESHIQTNLRSCRLNFLMGILTILAAVGFAYIDYQSQIHSDEAERETKKIEREIRQIQDSLKAHEDKK